LLNHPAQKSRCVDSTLGFVNGAAIATHLGNVAGHAFVVCNQLLAQLEIGILENGRLSLGMKPPQNQRHCKHGTKVVTKFHGDLQSKKPPKESPKSGKKSHEYQSSFLQN
jgi:hypothetical protein